MTHGDRVLVIHLGRHGRYLGEYDGKAVVRLERSGEQRLFEPGAVIPVEHRPVAAQLKLTPPAGLSEEDVQAATIRELESRGYVVLQTSVRYHSQQCPHCGEWHRPTGGTGASFGVPDLLVSHERWPVAMWRGIEKKEPKGGLRPEQELLLAQARIVVSRSVDEAVRYADQAAAGFVIAGMEPPALDRDAISRAQAKVEKARQKRAEQRAKSRAQRSAVRRV